MTNEHLQENKETFEELCFALHHRDAPTLVFVSINNEAFKKKISKQLEEELTEYQFYYLDTTPDDISSLHSFLQHRLPKEILEPVVPPKYVVNLSGLENNLVTTKSDRLVYSTLVAQMNFERELLFRNAPYITIIWAPKDFIAKLNKDAPDLSHWVTYQFHFECGTGEIVEKVDFHFTEKLKMPGNLPERRNRIELLNGQLAQLNIGQADKARLIKDKIGLLQEIAEEHSQMQQYNAAIRFYNDALILAAKLPQPDDFSAHIYFDLGTALLESRSLKLSLEAYEKSLDFLKEKNDEQNFAAVYHEIGRVYQHEHKWAEALDRYSLALQWYEKNGNEYGMGGTYHQIGMVYEMQEKWTDAFVNYNLALQWEEKTGNEYAMGSTYHQIGIVYEAQEKWRDALANYNLALQWEEKTGNEYVMGDTYHQIGRVYEKQQKWSEALENYNLALQWYEKTGNEYAMGSTYDRLGMVYEEQHKWSEALANYNLALQWQEKTGNEYEMGKTYHHIGIVYEEQQQWSEALDNYNHALQWEEKKGNEYDIGRTYHQIGRVYEEQENHQLAADFFKQAIDWLKKVGDEGSLVVAQNSLERVIAKINMVVS